MTRVILQRQSAQSQLAGILRIAQATAAVAPKAEFPFEANVQLACKKDKRVNQIRSQHSDAVVLLREQPKTVCELQRQQQRGRSWAVRDHMHRTALEYHLRPLQRDQWLGRPGGTHECLGFEQAGLARICCNSCEGLTSFDNFVGENPAIFGCGSS
jgi:hypothetical protein